MDPLNFVLKGLFGGISYLTGNAFINSISFDTYIID